MGSNCVTLMLHAHHEAHVQPEYYCIALHHKVAGRTLQHKLYFKCKNRVLTLNHGVTGITPLHVLQRLCAHNCGRCN